MKVMVDISAKEVPYSVPIEEIILYIKAKLSAIFNADVVVMSNDYDLADAVRGYSFKKGNKLNEQQ
jgi:hypothetical protein